MVTLSPSQALDLQEPHLLEMVNQKLERVSHQNKVPKTSLKTKFYVVTDHSIESFNLDEISEVLESTTEKVNQKQSFRFEILVSLKEREVQPLKIKLARVVYQ